MLSSVPPIQLSLGLSLPLPPLEAQSPPGPAQAHRAGLSLPPNPGSPLSLRRCSLWMPLITPLSFKPFWGRRVSHKDRDYLLHLWFVPSLELGLSTSWFPNGLSLTPACPQFHNSHCHADSTWGWNLLPREQVLPMKHYVWAAMQLPQKEFVLEQ